VFLDKLTIGPEQQKKSISEKWWNPARWFRGIFGSP